ncbi:MAG: MqnA/MqnD/SBP family protein [Oscillospiraceae bacterium]
MKKFLPAALSLVLCLALLFGCAPKAPLVLENLPAVRMASLKGPTTMGLVKLLSDAKSGLTSYALESEVYGTAEEVFALLIKGKVDIAAIPANLAGVLYNKTNGEIQAAAVNTLGVLYIVENGDSIHSVSDLRGKTIYSTGKGTTPEFVLNYILSKNGIDPTTDLKIEYKSEATEIAAMLRSSDSGAVALLPQPYVTSVLMQNKDFRIALDLTHEWDEVSEDGALVTGVIVVRREFAENSPELLKSFLSDCADSAKYVNANPSKAGKLIEEYGIVANSKIAATAIPHCNITYIAGAEMKALLSGYLSVLFEQNPKSVGGVMPDEGFYLAS